VLTRFDRDRSFVVARGVTAGEMHFTAEAALDLAEALGTSPKLWMNLQATFDLDRAARAREVA